MDIKKLCEDIVNRANKAGVGVRDVCLRANVNVSTFNRWRNGSVDPLKNPRALERAMQKIEEGPPSEAGARMWLDEAKAIASGAEIEWYSPHLETWVIVPDPTLSETSRYRVKLEEKGEGLCVDPTESETS